MHERSTDLDTASRESGIDDQSEELSSREGSNNDLKQLAKKTSIGKSISNDNHTVDLSNNKLDDINSKLSSFGSSSIDFFKKYFKWLLFLIYNAYLILGVCRTWNKVST